VNTLKVQDAILSVIKCVGARESKSAAGQFINRILTLPMLRFARLQLALRGPEMTSQPTDERRKRVLCVEDDRDTASLLCEELNDRGFEAHAAYNGRDGLAFIFKNPPDLVLSDIGMPGMSGFELLEKVTSLAPRFGSMPFVFLTALGDHENELKGWQLGADDYVTKPVDYDVLAALISARLARVARSTVWPNRVGLRDREVETLTWAARGKTFGEIGEILGLSKRTVEFHLDNARRKLGVATRTQALIKAATGHLIQP
jgi:DNA-binding NarL/FixJ family response regulator